jgi:methylmalonyl-CoA/ethylmalonyl-CoA epimerase
MEFGMSNVIKINHVAIAVNDLDSSLFFWRDVLGLTLDHVEEVPSQKANVAFFPVGDSEIELVQPTDPESGLGKFLESRGPGIHHLCFEVDDIDASLAVMQEKGVQLINKEPLELPGRKLAFVHPRSTGGVLIELYELIGQG